MTKEKEEFQVRGKVIICYSRETNRLTAYSTGSLTITPLDSHHREQGVSVTFENPNNVGAKFLDTNGQGIISVYIK